MSIIFVSKLDSVDDGASSTDIMTLNLINGLSQNTIISKLIIIVNKDNFQNIDNIKTSLTPLCEQLIIVRSSNTTPKNKWVGLWQLIFANRAISKWGASLKLNDTENLLLISQSPSYDSIHVCRKIKKNYPRLHYIQYWSDPIAISGIMPERLNYKRLIFKFIEKSGLKLANKIVYGTKTLFEAQKQVYPKFKEKMSYIDISYSSFECQEMLNDFKYNNDKFLYAGNYFSKIRNITPLFNAINSLNGEVRLDVYGSGDIETRSEFIYLHNRISPLELRREEVKYRTVICVLNSNCAQIPGKIFYSMNLDQNILVILDGDRKDKIAKYLKSYNRFIMCDNNAESIKNTLHYLISNNVTIKDYENDKYSPKAVANELLKMV